MIILLLLVTSKCLDFSNSEEKRRVRQCSKVAVQRVMKDSGIIPARVDTAKRSQAIKGNECRNRPGGSGKSYCILYLSVRNHGNGVLGYVDSWLMKWCALKQFYY